MTVPKKISEIVHKITPQEIYLHYGFYKFKKKHPHQITVVTD